MSPPPNAQVMCTTTMTPTLTWTDSSKQSLAWLSQYDIQTITQPSLLAANKLILKSHGINTATGTNADLNALSNAIIVPSTDKTSLNSTRRQKIVNDTTAFDNNNQAYANWQSMLQFNFDLKSNASAWPEFTQAMGPPSSNSAATNKVLNEVGTSGSSLDTSRVADPSKGSAPGSPTSYGLSTNNGIGSILFSDSSSLVFTLAVASSAEHTRNLDIAFDVTAGGSIDFKMAALLSVLETNVASSTHGGIKHGTTQASTTGSTTTITGDEFQVEVKLDKVYGSPVYKIIGGRSRCMYEGTTGINGIPFASLGLDPPMQARDAITMSFATILPNANPFAPLSTILTMKNQSPTGESFNYGLTINEETNPFGLVLMINGQVIPGTNGTPLYFAVAWNIDLSVTVDIIRGSGAYVFTDVTLSLTGSPTNYVVSVVGNSCPSVTTTLSVSFAQPCAAIAFAGDLASYPTFTVNRYGIDSQTPAILDGSGNRIPTLPIMINNPERSLPGRGWAALAASNFLTSMRIEFRSTNVPAGAVLSELAWTSISKVGGDMLGNIVTNADALKNNSYSSVMDMSQMADGNYQLRAITQCTATPGVFDQTIFTVSTPIISGILDTNPLIQFGSTMPPPGGGGYFPGQPIRVVFNKAINCQSYAGKASVKAYINAGTVDLGITNGAAVDDLQYSCSGSTIDVALTPIWDNLVTRLLTIVVSNVHDLGGNGLDSLNPTIHWSFIVSPFNVDDSSVLIDNIVLSQSCENIISSYGEDSVAAAVINTLTHKPNVYGTVQLQIAIGKQIAALVNAAIAASPPVLIPARTTSSGRTLLPGSVISSNFQSSSATCTFSARIIAPPQFVGDDVLAYSPTVFASVLSAAVIPSLMTIVTIITPANITAGIPAVTSSKTSTTTLYASNAHPETYPILTLLKANQTFVITTTTLPSAAVSSSMNHARRRLLSTTMNSAATSTSAHASSLIAGHERIDVLPYTNIITSVGIGSITASTNVISIKWETQSTYAVPLSVLNLNIMMTLTADANSDPDVLAESTFGVFASIDTTNIALVALTQNINTLANKAVYQIILLSVPATYGGSNSAIVITVLDPSSSTPSTFYTVSTSAYLVAVPSSPLLISVAQVDAVTLSIVFHPSLADGLALNALDANVTYLANIQPSSAASMTSLPQSVVTIVRSTSIFGLQTITAMVNLTASATMGIALPSAGNDIMWTVGVSGMNMYGSSPVSSSPLLMQAVPARLTIKVVAQTALRTFNIRFYRPATPIVDGAAPIPAKVTYSYVDTITSATVTATIALSESSIAVMSPLQSSATLGVMNNINVTIPGAGALSAITWTMQATNVLGSSSLKVHANGVVPGYATTPIGFAMSSSSTSGLVHNIGLAWSAPITVAPSASALWGYAIDYSWTDGYQLNGTSSSSMMVLAPATVGSLIITSPMSTSPLFYTISISTVFYGSGLLSLLSRVDGTQPVLMRSDSSVPSASVYLSFTPPPLAGATTASTTGIAVTTSGAVSTSASLPSSTDISKFVASIGTPMNSISQLISGGTYTDGPFTIGAPIAPASISITQTGRQRVIVSFPISTTPYLTSSYSIIWSDASSSVNSLLGVMSVSPLSSVAGTIYTTIDDSSLAVNANALQNSHLFTFAVMAIAAQTNAPSLNSMMRTTQAMMTAPALYSSSMSASANQVCNQIEWAGANQNAMSIVIGAYNADGMTLRTNGYPITVRDVGWLSPNSWTIAHGAAILSDIVFRYRSAGGGDNAWMPMNSMTSVGSQSVKANFFTQGDASKEEFSFNWDTQLSSGGMYEIQARTECDQLTPNQFNTPIISVLYDVVAPVVVSSVPSTVNAASYQPLAPISATFNEPINCAAVTVAASVCVAPYTTSCVADATLHVPTIQFTCANNTISLSFVQPYWSELQSRIVTITASGIVDVALNPYSSLSFVLQFAAFDILASSVTVSGGSLNVDASIVSDVTFIPRLTNELTALINQQLLISSQLQINTVSNIGTTSSKAALVSRAASARKFASKQLAVAPSTTRIAIVSMSSTSPIRFLFDIHPPQVVGDVTSASDMANAFLAAVGSGVYNSASTPLLSLLNAPRGNALSAFVIAMSTVPSAAATGAIITSSSATTAAGQLIGVSTMSQMSANNSISTVRVSWTLPTSATPGDLAGHWMVAVSRVLDMNTDNVDFDGDLNLMIGQYDSTAPLSRACSFTTDGVATFSIILPLSTMIGGSTVQFAVSDANRATSTNAILSTNVFIAGPPSTPMLISVIQPSPSVVVLTYVPSAYNGIVLSETNNPANNGLIYDIFLQCAMMPTILVPISAETFTMGNGVSTVSISLSSFASWSMMTLPSAGASFVASFAIVARSSLTSSLPSLLPIIIGNVPAPLSRLHSQQISLSQFRIMFAAPSSGSVITSYAAGFSLIGSTSDYAVDGASSITVSTCSTSGAPALITDAGALICLIVTIRPTSGSSTPPSMLSIGVSATNSVGTSAVVLQRVFPVFVAAPTGVTAVMQQATLGQFISTPQSVLVSWSAAIQATSTVLSGYVVVVTSNYAGQPVMLPYGIVSSASVNITDPTVTSTIINNLDPLASSYNVAVFTKMSSSSNVVRIAQRTVATILSSSSTPYAFTFISPLPSISITSVRQLSSTSVLIAYAPSSSSSGPYIVSMLSSSSSMSNNTNGYTNLVLQPSTTANTLVATIASSAPGQSSQLQFVVQTSNIAGLSLTPSVPFTFTAVGPAPVSTITAGSVGAAAGPITSTVTYTSSDATTSTRSALITRSSFIDANNKGTVSLAMTLPIDAPSSDYVNANLIVSLQLVPDLYEDNLDIVGSTSYPIVATANCGVVNTAIYYCMFDNVRTFTIFFYGLPLVPSGDTYQLVVSNSANAARVPIMFTTQIFLVGPPSAPIALSATQLDPTTIQIQYLPSPFNGLVVAENNGAPTSNSITYAIYARSPSDANVATLLSSSIISVPSGQSSYYNANTGLQTMVINIASITGFTLPTSTSSTLWYFSIVAQTSISASLPVVVPITIVALPASISKIHVQQLTLNSYRLMFPASSGSTIIDYSGGYSLTHSASDAMPDPLSTLTLNSCAVNGTIVAASTPGSLLCIIVITPAIIAPVSNSQLSVFVNARNSAGSAVPFLQRVYPTFVTAPISVTAVQIASPVGEYATTPISTTISWVASASPPTSFSPAVTSAQLTQSLVVGTEVHVTASYASTTAPAPILPSGIVSSVKLVFNTTVSSCTLTNLDPLASQYLIETFTRQTSSNNVMKLQQGVPVTMLSLATSYVFKFGSVSPSIVVTSVRQVSSTSAIIFYTPLPSFAPAITSYVASMSTASSSSSISSNGYTVLTSTPIVGGGLLVTGLPPSPLGTIVTLSLSIQSVNVAGMSAPSPFIFNLLGVPSSSSLMTAQTQLYPSTDGSVRSLNSTRRSYIDANMNGQIELQWSMSSSAPSRDTSAAFVVAVQQVTDYQFDDLDQIGSSSYNIVTADCSKPNNAAYLCMNDNAGTYSLFIFALPLAITGTTYQLSLIDNARVNATTLFTTQVFLIGPPSQPTSLVAAQTGVNTLQVRFSPSSYNGVILSELNAADPTKNGLTYAVTIASIVVPSTSAVLTIINGMAQINITTTSVQGLILPVGGNDASWTITITANSAVSSSSTVSTTMLMCSIPSSVPRLQTQQLTLNTFRLMFTTAPISVGTPIIDFTAGYSTTHSIVDIVYDPTSVSSIGSCYSNGSPAVAGSVGALYCLILTTPMPTVAISNNMLSVVVVARNAIGSSAPQLQRLYPAYVSPPASIALSSLSASSALSYSPSSVMLSWNSSTVAPPSWNAATIVPSSSVPDLRVGYEVHINSQYTTLPASGPFTPVITSTFQKLVFDNNTYSTVLTNMDASASWYVVSVYARILSSSNAVKQAQGTVVTMSSLPTSLPLACQCGTITLGVLTKYSVFTGIGAITITDTASSLSMCNGDVGTASGAQTVTRSSVNANTMLHAVGDADTIAAAAAVTSIFTSISARTNTGGGVFALGAAIGGTVGSASSPFTPGVWSASGAVNMIGSIVFDAGGNTAATFTIITGGAFTQSASTSMILKNGATVNNIYWSIAGAVTTGASSIMIGTFVVKGAVSTGVSTVLTGRILVTAGAVSLSATIITPPSCACSWRAWPSSVPQVMKTMSNSDDNVVDQASSMHTMSNSANSDDGDQSSAAPLAPAPLPMRESGWARRKRQHKN